MPAKQITEETKKMLDRIELQKKFVTVGFEENKNAKDQTYVNAFGSNDEEHKFTLQKFREEFKIKITEKREDYLEFEMEGISAAFANAFRRIILAEVPQMAIERVYFVQNTSVIADEIFAHRLGLVPILADPNMFEEYEKETEELLTEKNTIVFKMKVKCEKERDSSGVAVPDSILHEKVYSKDLVWLPAGSELNKEDLEREKGLPTTYSNFSESQEIKFGKNGIKTVHDDILLAKLVPGQEIELEAHCMKSVGSDHAKFSPVGTCWYRLVPTIIFKKPITGTDAKVFVSECSDPIPNHKCFELKGSGAKASVEIKSTRGCDLCLERVRELTGEGDWAEKVIVLKKRDHYIFTIESVGSRTPEVIFKEAVNILSSKCQAALGTL